MFIGSADPRSLQILRGICISIAIIDMLENVIEIWISTL
jgi:hypothetical protein